MKEDNQKDQKKKKKNPKKKNKSKGTFFEKHLEYKDDSYKINRFYNKLIDGFNTLTGNPKTNQKLEKYKNYNFVKNSLIFLAIEYLIGVGIINTLPYPQYKAVYLATFASILVFAGYSVYKHIKAFKDKRFMPWLQVVLSLLHIFVFIGLIRQI